MKKILAILALAATSTAFAADYLSVDVDNVLGRDAQVTALHNTFVLVKKSVAFSSVYKVVQLQ